MSLSTGGTVHRLGRLKSVGEGTCAGREDRRLHPGAAWLREEEHGNGGRCMQAGDLALEGPF